MTINLNKIDPVIVNNIHRQTTEGVVHNYEGIKVSKDAKEKKEGGSSGKKNKDKVVKFNSLLEAMGIDMRLIVEGDTIVGVDGDGRRVKVYTREAIIELLNKMEDMLGVFIDTKK